MLSRLKKLAIGDDDEPAWLTLYRFGTAAEFVAVTIFVWCSLPEGSVGGALVVASGMYVLGLLLGFLFGHPRWLEGVVSGGAPARRSKPSTNLEKVSDWLTTLLVGLTLVQFDAVKDRAWTLITALAPSIVAGPRGESAAVAIGLLFTTTGFLLGYLYTRLKLQDEFDRDRLSEEPAYLEGVMNAYLYEDPPEGFRKALATAAEYRARFPDAGNYRVHLQTAIAHAQAFKFHQARSAKATSPTDSDGTSREDARKRCLEALGEAYAREPECIEFLHLIWEPALAPATENDLTCFRDDNDFKEFFQTRVPNQRMQCLVRLDSRAAVAPDEVKTVPPS